MKRGHERRGDQLSVALALVAPLGVYGVAIVISTGHPCTAPGCPCAARYYRVAGQGAATRMMQTGVWVIPGAPPSAGSRA
jgi:hypothetical protein